MITKIIIPKLTLTMEGGSVLRWLKKEGDSVEKDETLLELETDKAVAEVPSPTHGVLRKIVVEAGQVEVGATVGFVGEASDPLPAVTPTAPGRTGATLPESPVSEAPVTSPVATGRLRATPAARRRAKELGVNLEYVKPTGPEGRISLEDVERAGTAPPEAETFANVNTDTRAIITNRMSHAWQTVPHIHIAGQLRAAGLRTALAKARRSISPEISITDLLLYSLGKVLPRFPILNSVWQEAKPQSQHQINLSFAVQTERGVVAPVIRDVEGAPLATISAERRRLSKAAQTWRLKPSELEGGTFTLTNLGMFPVDFFLPIINYPQSGILATGRIRDHVEIHDDKPQSVPSIWANAAVDHRVADGAVAAGFLSELEKTFDALEGDMSGD